MSLLPRKTSLKTTSQDAEVFGDALFVGAVALLGTAVEFSFGDILGGIQKMSNQKYVY
jgi:hypothetical protein